MFPHFSYIIRLLFPFRYPMKLDTLIFGGISIRHMYVIRAHLCLSYIHPLPLTELPQYLAYLCSFFSEEHFSPKFWRKYYMVLAIPLRM